MNPSNSHSVLDVKVLKPGAKFNHNCKEAKNLYQQALNSNPSTIVLYMDVTMNSLTVAPWLNPMQHRSESPERIIHILRGLERKANTRDISFVVVLNRRRKTDEKK